MCKLGQCRRRLAAAAAVAAAATAATGSGAGRVRSETPTEQPRPNGGPGAAARAPLQPSPLPDQHLPAPRAPNVMEARRSRAARCRSDLRRLGRAAAAAGPLAAQAGGGAQKRRAGCGRCCYARPAPRTRPPRCLALQSRGPLATSFFHSQKRKGEKKNREKGGNKGVGEYPDGSRGRHRSPRRPVGGKGLRGGEGAGK